MNKRWFRIFFGFCALLILAACQQKASKPTETPIRETEVIVAIHNGEIVRLYIDAAGKLTQTKSLMPAGMNGFGGYNPFFTENDGEWVWAYNETDKMIYRIATDGSHRFQKSMKNDEKAIKNLASTAASALDPANHETGPSLETVDGSLRYYAGMKVEPVTVSTDGKWSYPTWWKQGYESAWAGK